MRTLVLLAALAVLVAVPLARSKTIATDPKDARGKLDLKTVAAVRHDTLLRLKIRMYGAWSSKLLRGKKGRSGPAGGHDRLVVLYDTNGDGRPDYTGRIVYWKGYLRLWIAGRRGAFEPVPVKRPNARTASFAHPVDVLFSPQKGKRTLGLAVKSVDREGAACSPACRDRAPNEGWIRVVLSGPKAGNLVAGPKVKKALRSAFLHAHRTDSPRSVKGPLEGTTYYGRYGRTKYAFATFSIPKFRTQDQPELFKRLPGHAWRDLGDTGGEICKREVPLALIEVWQLERGSPGCYFPR